ncbi:MAG: CHASE domain-containing protein, partial [Burkholderiales bacterium]|nr:CHASE domain-containing protein [Burkholderiales bacterium]
MTPRPSYAAQAGVALACAAGAWLGCALAVPPGPMPVIWPPAGIALAAALLGGPGVWPGIFIGALAGPWLRWAGSAPPSALTLALAAFVALGATAQALAGAVLLRRAGPGATRLVHPGAIARLYVLGGLVPGLIGATVDLGAGLVVHPLPWGAAARAWAQHDAAQVLGVVVVAPLLLLAWRLGDAAGRARALRVGGGALVALALTAVLTLATDRGERQDLKLRFSEVTQAALATLDRSIHGQLNAVGALEAYLSVDEALDAGRFAQFASRIRARNDSIAVLEWIPRVARRDRAAFEAWAQRHGDPGFRIHEAPGASDASARPDQFPVAYADPLAVNRQALGFDLGSNPARLVALERSRDSGSTAVTERIALVQDGKPAVLAAVPVFDSGAPTRTPEQRRAALKGYALGVLRLAELIGGALQTASAQDMHCWVEDRSTPGQATLLYSNRGDAPAPAAGADGLLDRYRLDVGGRRWMLSCASTPGFLLQHVGWNIWMAMFVGLLLTGAVIAVALVVTGQDQSLRTLVADRTRELRVSEDRLQVALSASNTGSWDWHPQTGEAIFSDTWFTMLGYAPAALPARGTTFFDLIHPGDAPRVQAVVQAVLAGQRPAMDEEFRMRRHDGGWTWIKAAGRVVERDAAGRALRMSGVHVDVSAARQISADLAQARDAAIRASQAKSAFLAAVSHELRTPLTSIRGFAELLESRLPEARHRQQAGLIRSASEHLNALLTEILDLAKVEAGS